MRLLLSVFILSLLSCSASESEETGSGTMHQWKPTYAKGFYLEMEGTDTTLVICRPEDSSRIVLRISCGTRKPGKELQLPVKRFTSISTTHLAFLEKMGLEQMLIGFAGLRYIHSDVYRKRIDKNEIAEIGTEEQINVEKLLESKPDVFLCYPTVTNSFELISKSGVPVIPIPDYLENHPLARAEYIKLIGLLTGKFDQACRIFNTVETKYKNVRTACETTSGAACAFAGIPIEGTWYVPASESYVARFIGDAGATYLYADVPGANVQTKPIEAVIEKAARCDYWFFIYSSPAQYTYKTLVHAFPYLENISCIKNKNVFPCNSETDDVFGTGIMEPDVILSDLAYALHPDKFKGYKPVYFKTLDD